jgi:outer membrane lipoprotein-sorting protein
MKRRVTYMAGAAVVLFCTSTVLAETLDEVLKAIVDKAESCQSQQARIISAQQIHNPQMKMDSQSEMAYECLKKGDQWLYRSESKTKTTSTLGDQEIKQAGTVLVVFDGEYAWTMSDMGGQKVAVKNRPTAAFSMVANKAYFDNLKQSFTLKALPDETVDGKAAWVIEATRREASPEGMLAVLVSYFDKETGISLKSVGKDSQGKEVMTSTTKDIKVNSPLPADHFVFKAPEGVQVMDMTQGQPDQPQAEPDEQKPEQPKQPEQAKQPKKGQPRKPGIKLPKLP